MTKVVRCSRCAADPRPANFGSDRECAFGPDGAFLTDNWNCATLDALAALAGEPVYGDDETLAVVRCDFADGGFLVLTRYKSRGRVTGLAWVGDWPAPRAASLGLVLRAIAFNQPKAVQP